MTVITIVSILFGVYAAALVWAATGLYFSRFATRQTRPAKFSAGCKSCGYSDLFPVCTAAGVRHCGCCGSRF